MYIAEETIARIRESADIVVLAREHLGLAVCRSGANTFKTVCPFPDHPDSADDGGSCSLRRLSNSFFCFGCKRSGSVFDFFCVVKGYGKGDGDGWLRAAVELHRLFQMPFDLSVVDGGRREEWQSLCAWLGTLRDAHPLVPVKEGMYKALQSPSEVRRMPSGTGGMFRECEGLVGGVRYPLVATLIPAIAVVSLNERATGRLCGVWSLGGTAFDFRVRHGLPRALCGRELSGESVSGLVPRFFSTSLAFENPLDFVLAARARYPVMWGMWSRAAVSGSPFADSVPCYIAMLFDGQVSQESRFMQVAQRAGDWLPRWYRVAGRCSLLPVREDQRLALLERAMTRSASVALASGAVR